MNTLIILLLLCLTVINEAKIKINIEAGKRESDIQINYSGYDINVISNKDVELFQINDNNLKESIKNYLGRRPNKVYLKSPTPWGDLYKRYQWEQVTKVTTVQSARIKTSELKSFAVSSHDFENPSRNIIKVNAGLTQSVENTISTAWSIDKEFTVSQSFEYDLNVIFAKVSGATEFSFTSSWGKTDEKSESVTIGTTTGFEMELKPGQAVTTVLTASRRILEIEIVYGVSLRGNVAVNYKKPLKGHHFHFPSIEGVLNNNGLPRELKVVETIALGLYTDSSLKVYDKESMIPI